MRENKVSFKLYEIERSCMLKLNHCFKGEKEGFKTTASKNNVFFLKIFLETRRRSELSWGVNDV